MVLRALLGCLLDVKAGARIVAQVDDPCKTVKAVADCDVDGLSEYAVPFLTVGQNLGVASTHVQNHRVLGIRDDSAHLDMADAVVNTDHRLVVKERQRPAD